MLPVYFIFKVYPEYRVPSVYQVYGKETFFLCYSSVLHDIGCLVVLSHDPGRARARAGPIKILYTQQYIKKARPVICYRHTG